MRFLSVLIEIRKILFILNIIFFCLQSFHNLIKDFHIIIVNSQFISKFKTNIISGTSLCTLIQITKWSFSEIFSLLAARFSATLSASRISVEPNMFEAAQWL